MSATETKRGVTWLAGGPCPNCGGYDIIGVLLVTEEGKHQHTKYICTRYGRGKTAPCGWEGWSVPGWDDG